MKFKNKEHEFEYNILEMDENQYAKKLSVMKKLNNFIDKLDENILKNGLKKWQDSTNKKRFKKKIIESLNLLNKETLSYSDKVFILTTLSSIKTHIMIELQYFEVNYSAMVEFLNIFDIFLNETYEIEKDLIKSLFDENFLNNKKDTIEKLINIFNFFKD